MNRHLGTKLMAAVIVATALVFIWSLNSHQVTDQRSDTWVDQAGRLHVLDIELGRTTLREAEIALKSRSDTALYIYPEQHPRAGIRLEAFFPSIADHSKVILELEAGAPLLKHLQERATIPHLYPNKVARMNLHPEDLLTVQRLIVGKVTLIPSIHVSHEMLRNRFGEASNSSVTEDGTEHYYYPSIGLHATVFKDDATRLEFSNPTTK